MFGINEVKKETTMNKVRGTKHYLFNNFCDVGGKTYAYGDFFKNSFINADRYIAELQNRAWSLYNYAKSQDLVNVFVTLTLPSEYHPKKTFKGKTIPNPKYIDDEAHQPKAGSKMLSQYMREITNDRIYRKIPKEKRVYFRVTEPHKDGTPHIHVSFFIPQEYVKSFVNMIQRKFPQPQSKVETNVHNPVNYLMKYILKTLDDLRGNDDNITDLTLWYIYHGINRFYTSRTLISLNIYRVLGGRYSLLELTTMYKNRELTVYYDPQTNKVMEIFDDIGQIYNRKPVNITSISSYPSMRLEQKPTLKSFMKKEACYTIPSEYDLDNKIVTPAYMGDLELYDYYNGLDVEDEETTLLHYGITQNEMINRGLLKNMPLNDLDNFTIDFGEVHEFTR
ncbi:MAG: replication endonuclease [Epsilonproteobacteria bacterium]|nr:replication endonuclease [Campylobacterota bacterium]